MANSKLYPADCGATPFLLSRPVPDVKPAVIRGPLVYTVADVSFTSMRQVACAWRAAKAHRLDIIDQSAQDAPLRRCDDCALNFGRDVLRALGTCPRWGKQRHGVESRCPAFVAKDGAR